MPDESAADARPATRSRRPVSGTPEQASDADRSSPTPASPPRCFVIAPIGREGSETRKRSDQILRHIIEPVVTSEGYARPVRADGISESGRITRQIIQRIIEDELVVADLTESNPNVYYELALRHAIKKPFVQILAGEDPLPFDVADQRTVMVNHQDLDSVAAAKDELRRQVQALADGTAEVDTPLTFAIDVASLRGSDNPGDRTQGELLEMLQEVRTMARNTFTAVRRPGIHSADLAALRRYVEVTSSAGNVVDADVNALIGPNTSRSHDEWVTAVKSRMNPFMPSARDASPDPWASPGPSDEPPF